MSIYILTQPLPRMNVGDRFEKHGETETHVQLIPQLRKESMLAIPKEQFLACFEEVEGA